ICFIDELHTLVGAGAAEGAVDAANMLKPALARGELRCVGATTLDEYRKHVEKDPALERRFQPVMVREPSVEDTIAILRGLQDKSAGLKARWQAEKAGITRIGTIKEEIEAARHAMADAERRGDLNRAAELRYGTLLTLEKRLAELEAQLHDQHAQGRMLREE